MKGRKSKLTIRNQIFKDCLEFLSAIKDEGYKISSTEQAILKKFCRDILNCSNSRANEIVNFLIRIHIGALDYP